MEIMLNLFSKNELGNELLFKNKKAVSHVTEIQALLNV